MSQEQVQERVAVLVVHGVADQKPGETVRQVARLLSHGAAGEPRFVQGEIRDVLVPVGRLEPGSACAEAVTVQEMPVDAQNRPGAPSGFYQQHRRLDDDCVAQTPTQDLSCDLNDYLLSRLELTDDDALYEGTRISLRHRTSGRAVDLFEMYWADLSRLGQGGFAALGSLYHLFISLSTLAADVVDQAAMSQQQSRAWGGLQRLHAWSAWLLRGPSLLIQVCMMLLFVFGAFALIPLVSQAQVLVGLFCVGAVALTAVAFYVRIRTVSVWLPLLLGVLALSSLASAVFTQWDGRGHLYLYFGTTAAVSSVIGLWLVERYAQSVHGIRAVGLILLALTNVLLVSEAIRVWPYATTMQEWLLSAALGVGELLYGLILLTWTVFIVVQVCALFLGLWLGRGASVPVRCSLYTARLGLVSATALFAILSLVLWSVMSYIASFWLGDIFYEARFFDAGTWTSGAAYLDARIRSLGGFFTPLVVLSTLVGIAGFIVLAPALLEEIQPSINLDHKGLRPNADRWCGRLGNWLSSGSHLLGRLLQVLIPVGAFAGSALYFAFVIRQFAFVLGFDAPVLQTLNNWLDLFHGEALVAAGKWLAGGAVLVTVLGSRFSNTFGRLRVALDALTDVSNYFDDPPNGQSPRARIYARFTSMLSYLRSAGYCRVVIVAHSQGTVISADLLRYLQVQGRLSDTVGDMRLSLLTVGSPLRDLYAERFPLLYQWLGGSPTEFASATPSASDLGVQEWVNVCRSGDYVGRFIWSPLRNSESFAISTLSAQGYGEARCAEGRREFCLGAGGHTRYFSNDALVLGREIERLLMV